MTIVNQKDIHGMGIEFPFLGTVGHVDFFQIILVVLGFLLARVLNRIDKNQAALSERMAAMERVVYGLIGEHRIMMAKNKHCNGDDP